MFHAADTWAMTMTTLNRLQNLDAVLCSSMQTAQKRQYRPNKTWDDVLQDGRKKLWILENRFSYPQNRSERRGRSRGRLVRKSNRR